MISQYKNIERLRYRISNDIAKASKTTDTVLTRAVEAIFSTVLSYYLSSSTLPLFNTNDNTIQPTQWLVFLFLRIVIFLLFFILAFILIKLIILVYKSVKIVGRKKKTGIKDKQKATKDFDNIALDSLMLVEEYIAIYSNRKTPLKPELEKFYIYEIVHYTLTACNYALPLIKKSCITYSGDEMSPYVEEDRFINFLSILKSQKDFLHEPGPSNYIEKTTVLKKRVEEIDEAYETLSAYKNCQSENKEKKGSKN